MAFTQFRERNIIVETIYKIKYAYKQIVVPLFKNGKKETLVFPRYSAYPILDTKFFSFLKSCFLEICIANVQRMLLRDFEC